MRRCLSLMKLILKNGKNSLPLRKTHVLSNTMDILMIIKGDLHPSIKEGASPIEKRTSPPPSTKELTLKLSVDHFTL